jgi:hypothetical protein
MKVRVNCSIDCLKIDKSRMKQVTKKDGSKAAYIELTTYLDTDKNSDFGDHGFINQQTSKEEREAGVQTPILGNCTIVWVDTDDVAQEPTRPSQPKQDSFMDDDIPF